MNAIKQQAAIIHEGAAPAGEHPAEGRSASLETTIIVPRTGWQWLDLRELWRYRDLLYFLAWRDIKVRYKQTILGGVWAILQPLLTMVVFSIFFGNLGGLDRQVDVPYPIFVYAGILLWTLFASTVTQASNSLVASSNLITKIYFPRLIVPASTAGASVVDFGVALVVMLVLLPCYGVGFSARLLLVVPLVVLTLLVALGVGAFLAAMTVAYRDFRYVIPFVVQLWMFASPVAYPLDVVPPEWRLAYAINPMAGLIGGFRAAFLGQAMPWGPLGVSVLTGMACFLLGVAHFRNAESRFADIV